MNNHIAFRSISEDLVVVGDTSEGKDEEDKFIPKKKSLMDKKASTGTLSLYTSFK